MTADPLTADPTVSGMGAVPARLTASAAPAALAGAAAAAFALLAVVDPNEPGHYPTCPFLAVTGLFCPGCGSLRALHALTRGDLGTAVSLNVLAVAALPLLAVIWAGWTARTWSGRPRVSVAAPWILWALLGLVLGYAVVRNLPFGAALAP